MDGSLGEGNKMGTERRRRRNTYRKKRQRRQNRMSMFLVTLVVVMILVVVGIKSISLREKGADYDATIAGLEKQIEEENVRTREIKEYEDYTKTNAFVEQMAHSKLGLVYENETIFIDKDE